jgi:hypothetical protein
MKFALLEISSPLSWLDLYKLLTIFLRNRHIGPLAYVPLRQDG